MKSSLLTNTFLPVRQLSSESGSVVTTWEQNLHGIINPVVNMLVTIRIDLKQRLR